MLRLAVTALLGTAVLAVPAAATMLGGGGGPTLAGGEATVAACDGTQTVQYATAGGEITSVTIGGIADPACSGGRLSVTLTAAGVAVASGGPVTVPSDADADDDAVTVPVTAGAAAAQVDRTDVLIEDDS